MGSMTELDTQQLATLLARTIPAGEPVLIEGSPGIGKSDVVAQAVAAADVDLITSHPVVADPTDAKGLPFPSPDGETATFLPFGDLARAMSVTRRTLWFLDDLGQATPAVQASFMQLLLARRINGHAIPDEITFVAATNRRTDHAGVTGILEPVKSRFMTIVRLVARIDPWVAWAMAAGVDPRVIAFLRFKPDLLCAFDPSRDMDNSPVPRTWAAVDRMLKLRLPRDVFPAAVAGAVGEGAATELIAFLDMYDQLPSIDGILRDADSAPIPSEPSALFAVATAVAARTDRGTMGQVARYAQRLLDAQRGEFAALMITDVTRRSPDLTETREFGRLVTGELGELIGAATA